MSSAIPRQGHLSCLKKVAESEQTCSNPKGRFLCGASFKLLLRLPSVKVCNLEAEINPFLSEWFLLMVFIVAPEIKVGHSLIFL